MIVMVMIEVRRGAFFVFGIFDISFRVLRFVIIDIYVYRYCLNSDQFGLFKIQIDSNTFYPKMQAYYPAVN